MARVEQNQYPFSHAGIDEVVLLYRTHQPVRYPRFNRIVNTRQGYHQVAQEGDFPAAAVMNQATGAPFNEFQQGPYATYYPTKRGTGFSVAREVVESDITGIMDRVPPKMARAMVRAIEADMANHLNLATGTQITPPDGVALAGTHLTQVGSYSNILAGNPALSITAIENAVSAMTQQPSASGDPLMMDGPWNLLVPPQLYFLAKRICESVRLPQSDNNDPNIISSDGYIKDIIASPFFTSPTAWALVTAVPDENPLVFLHRREFDTQEEFDKVKDIHIFIATEIWARVIDDWRGFEFSPGA